MHLTVLLNGQEVERTVQKDWASPLFTSYLQLQTFLLI